jgi:hypothetical protein
LSHDDFPAPGGISDELRRFILTSIPSVPYLEAIMLLRRERARAWTPEGVARNLYLPEATASEIVRGLVAAGIAVQGENAASNYMYQPPLELDALLDRLERLYSVRLVEVTRLIHSSLDRRAQHFADAFRLRKDS